MAGSLLNGARPNSSLKLKRWIQRRLRSTQPIPSPGDVGKVRKVFGFSQFAVFFIVFLCVFGHMNAFETHWNPKVFSLICPRLTKFGQTIWGNGRHGRCLERSAWWSSGVILTIYVTVGCTFLLCGAWWVDELVACGDGVLGFVEHSEDRGSATLHLSGQLRILDTGSRSWNSRCDSRPLWNCAMTTQMR